MNSINDIADYVILAAKADDNDISLSNLKLQKLLFYIQAWSYGINKKPLFQGDFQAWIHGPVNVEIFKRFKESEKNLFSEITLEDVKNKNPKINDEDKGFIDYILDNYLKYSGPDLERLSHSEEPWIKARGTCGSWDRCETVISPESLISFYGKKWDAINQKKLIHRS